MPLNSANLVLSHLQRRLRQLLSHVQTLRRIAPAKTLKHTLTIAPYASKFRARLYTPPPRISGQKAFFGGGGVCEARRGRNFIRPPLNAPPTPKGYVHGGVGVCKIWLRTKTYYSLLIQIRCSHSIYLISI